MTEEAGGRAEHVSVRSLDDLWALRTDWEDVPVPSLGGRVLRVYALSGTARARLMPDMARLSEQDEKNAETVADLLRFQNRVVGASLGLPEPDWDGAGSALGADAVEALYAVAARLSGLEPDAQRKAARRLPATRNSDSGSD